MNARDLLSARRALCVQPHYDDNDLAAGGTFAALADAALAIVQLIAHRVVVIAANASDIGTEAAHRLLTSGGNVGVNVDDATATEHIGTP